MSSPTLVVTDDSDFFRVLGVISKRKSVLVSGEAGTGKSTLMKRVYTHLIKDPLVNVSVVAPTGVAAVNAGGTTLHAWLGLGLAERDASYYLRKLDKYPIMVNNLSRTTHLIIDEISMVSPHMFCLIHTLCCFLRRGKGNKPELTREPFGGMVLLLFGDFCQLKSISRSSNKNTKPMVSVFGKEGVPNTEPQFVFETEVWKKLGVHRIWLRHNYRQGGDLEYAGILNRIRMGCVTVGDIKTLRKRVIYKLPSREVETDPQGRVEIMTPVLTTHKHGVIEHNQTFLHLVSRKFNTPVHTYHPDIQYKPNTGQREMTPGQLSSETDRLHDRFPVFQPRLCVNAQVMMRCNSMMKDHGIVNGTIGIIRFLSDKSIKVSFMVNGILLKPLSVSKHQFPMKLNNGTVYMKQFPLSLAYSCTIHKAQSISLDKAIVDIKNCFEESMVYVALSRVRSLSGLYIKGMFDSRWFHPNPLALKFETDPLILIERMLTDATIHNEIRRVILQYYTCLESN